jgi:hypothetical protein
MTSFVDDNGNFLDYQGTDIALTKQAASFYGFKIKGDISIDFVLPNTAKNRDILNYYGPQQETIVTSNSFTMVRDGNTISRGYIVIKESSSKEIKVFYISGNTNWFPRMDFNIKDIIFEDRFTVLGSDIDGQKAATEGIVFPLVDWWARNERRATSYIKINTGSYPDEFPSLTELFPCIYLHTIVSQMAVYAGIKIGGDLMDDPIYKRIIITPSGPEIYVPETIVNRTYAQIQNGPFGSAGAGLYDYTLDPQLIRFNTLIDGSGQIDTTNYSYIANYTGTYKVDIDFWVNNTDNYAVEAYLNGALYTVMFNDAVNTRNKVGTAYINMVKGDVLQFYVNNTAAANYRLDYLTDNKYTNFSIKLHRLAGVAVTPNLGSYSPADTIAYVIPNAIVPDMKAKDLIKFLSVYFGAVVTYDEYSKTLSINILDNIQKENAADWSEYFRGYSVKFDQTKARKNFIQAEGGVEDEIKAYNAQSLLSYGGGVIDTDTDNVETSNVHSLPDNIGDPVERKDIYKIPFSGSWDVKNKSYSKAFWPYVKFYELEKLETTTYSGVTNSGGLSQFTCTFNDPIEIDHVFYIISNSGVYSGFAPLYSGAGGVTSPQLLIDYIANDGGTIVKYRASKVNGTPRMLLCNPGKSITEIGGVDVETFIGTNSVSTITTAPVCWFDKPVLGQTIDIQKDSLAIDSQYDYNISSSERYYNTVKKIYQNPIIEVTLSLPMSEFASFDFSRFVYLKTEDITGYFFVDKIDNYTGEDSLVKVTLLYVD